MRSFKTTLARGWRRVAESVRAFVVILGFIFSPGVITGIAIFETIYWTSPQWVQTIGFPTYKGDKAREVVRCRELLAASCRTEVVHDGGAPLPPEGLPEWTPMRVEERFPSGLTVVSELGPHENFQYVVRSLALAEGITFRVVNGAIINI